MTSVAAAGDLPPPEPPDPPDPPNPPSNFAQTSISKPSSISLPFPLFHHLLSSSQDLDLGLTISSSKVIFFVYLRCFPAVCSSWFQISSEICFSLVGVQARSVCSVVSLSIWHVLSISLFARRRHGNFSLVAVAKRSSFPLMVGTRRLLLPESGSDVSAAMSPAPFASLSNRSFCFAPTISWMWSSTKTPLGVFNSIASLSLILKIDIVRLKPSPHTKPHLLFTSRSACSFFLSVIIVPLLFPQVCSYSSLSDSSTLGIYWMSVESVALTSWNPGLALAISMILDTLGAPFVLSSGTFIALVRNFTAVCRFYFELALLEVSLLQIVKRYLLSFTVPVNLVHRGSRSPHISFKELIILPNTSLVFSGIVIGSIVVKIVLLGAEARIVVQDFSRSAIADSLTLEALFPLHLVEPMSSPLSLSLYLSIVVFFSLPSYSITLLIFVVGVLALCCLLVSSIDGG